MNKTKNCEPFVFGPALAMESRPRPVCLRRKFSSNSMGSRLIPGQAQLILDGAHTGKPIPINGLAPPAVPLREIATLSHEPRNDPVKNRTLVMKLASRNATSPSLSRAKCPEVFHCPRHNICEELEFESSNYQIYVLFTLETSTNTTNLGDWRWKCRRTHMD